MDVNLIIPKKWIELSNKQLRFVSRLFHSDFSREKNKFLAHAFLFFSGLKIYSSKTKGSFLVKKKGGKKFYIKTAFIAYGANRLEWLLKEVGEIHPLRRILFTKPCSYRLYDTKFRQFLSAENWYEAFSQTKNVKYLNRLVATCYHFPGQKFNENKVISRAWKYKLVSFETKYTVYLWYSGFRGYVGQECPDIFGKGNGESVRIKDYIMGLIRGLTDGDVTKNESVQDTGIWDALYELNAKAKQAKEITAKYKMK
jgi:hypothetical protein